MAGVTGGALASLAKRKWDTSTTSTLKPAAAAATTTLTTRTALPILSIVPRRDATVADELLRQFDTDRGIASESSNQPKRRVKQLESSTSSSALGTSSIPIERSTSRIGSDDSATISPSVFVEADYAAGMEGSIFESESSLGASSSPSSGAHEEGSLLNGEDTRDVVNVGGHRAPQAPPTRPLFAAVDNFEPKLFWLLKRPENPSFVVKPDTQILHEARENDDHEFPRHINIAEHIKRKPNPDGTPRTDKKGKPLPPYTYRYWIYPRVQRLMQDMMKGVPRTRTAFVVVEENLELFMFIDWDLAKEVHVPEVHGNSFYALVGYSLAVTRQILSTILGVNLACMSDSCVSYDSSSDGKYSMHGHLPWPISGTLALRHIMEEYEQRIRAARKAGLFSAAPLFKRSLNANAGPNAEDSILDTTVYSTIRLFRLPFASKADKIPPVKLRETTQALPLWQAHIKQEGIEDGYLGVSAAMIYCRNSPSFWTDQTTKNPALRTQADQQAKSTDFRMLPLDGSSHSLRDTMKELLSTKHSDGFAWRYATDTQRIQTTIAAKMDVLFKLMYDEGSWAEVTRAYRSESVAGTEGSRLLESVYDMCSKSPRALVLVMRLWTQAYRPGGCFEQPLPAVKDLLAVDFIVNGASAIYEAMKTGSAVKTFEQFWLWRCEAELAFSTTASKKLRITRKKMIKDLGKDLCERFVARRIEGRRYNTEVLFDTLFMDEFISELFAWSGQAALTYEVPDEPTPLLQVPLQDKATLDKLYNFCFDTVCKRLQRHPEVPLATFADLIGAPPARTSLAEAAERARRRIPAINGERSEPIPFLNIAGRGESAAIEAT